MKEMFNHWVDFVTCPQNPDLINSKERRLGLGLNEWRGENKVHTIKSDVCVSDGDQFESMEVEGSGITIWTAQKVWVIRVDRGLERLVYLPRHPRAC